MGAPRRGLLRGPTRWSRGSRALKGSALGRWEGPDAGWGAPRSAPGPRPRGPGLGRRGSGAPSPGPAAATRPPSGAPSPSCPLPAPPAPRALTWKRFFTHSFFMAGEGAGPAAGRGGDGRGRGGVGGGAGGEAGSRRGAGGGRRRWRKEPRGRGSPGGGKAAAAAAAAAAGAGPSPASPHPPHRTPLPSPATLRPLGRRSPASRPPRPASALGETEAQKGVQWPLGEFGPLSHWPPNAASTPPPPASRGAAPEGQPHLHWLTPQTCARVRLSRQYPTRRRAVAPGGGAQIIHRARILVVTCTQNANPPRLLRKARKGPRVP